MAGLIYDFIETLSAEHEEYLKLLEIGNLKRVHIIKGNLKEMNDASTVEEHIVSKLKGFEKKRIELTADIAMILNLNKDTATITQIEEALHNQPEEAAALGKVKRQIKATLSELKVVNNENMLLINQSLDYAEFSINVLQSSMGAPPLTADYGANGKSKDSSIYGGKK